MNQQILDWAKEALEMLSDNHHLVADNEKHRYVMMHLDVIKRGKALLEQPEPVFCEYCGGNDDADFGLPTDHCTDCDRPDPAQPESVQEEKQSEIFCGVDFADGVLSVRVLRRRPNDVAELLHSEQIDLPLSAQPADHDVEKAVAYLNGVHTGKKIAKRVPLTDEQIDLLINGRGDEDDDDYVEPTGDGFGLTDEDLVKLVRRVEKHHGIEGTP